MGRACAEQERGQRRLKHLELIHNHVVFIKQNYKAAWVFSDRTPFCFNIVTKPCASPCKVASSSLLTTHLKPLLPSSNSADGYRMPLLFTKSLSCSCISHRHIQVEACLRQR